MSSALSEPTNFFANKSSLSSTAQIPWQQVSVINSVIIRQSCPTVFRTQHKWEDTAEGGASVWVQAWFCFRRYPRHFTSHCTGRATICVSPIIIPALLKFQCCTSDEIQNALSRLEEHHLRKQDTHQVMMAQMKASHVRRTSNITPHTY